MFGLISNTVSQWNRNTHEPSCNSATVGPQLLSNAHTYQADYLMIVGGSGGTASKSELGGSFSWLEGFLHQPVLRQMMERNTETEGDREIPSPSTVGSEELGVANCLSFVTF